MPDDALRPRAWNADRSGVSANWKAVGAVLAFFIASGTIWTALGLAKLSDLDDHNQSPGAHKVKVREGGVISIKDGQLQQEGGQEVIRSSDELLKRHDQVLLKQEAEHAVFAEELTEQRDIVVTVKNGFYEDRAERLADRAADKIASPRRSREVWKEVRERALQNLRDRRPIREGLERYLD